MKATNEKKTDLEREKLSGPVKQVMESRYKAHQKAGEVIQGKMDTEYSYNHKNCITTYNENGTKIKEELYEHGTRKIMLYNEKGLQTGAMEYRDGKEEKKTT